ncbi:MAG TPA: FG-GAP-like repeat-containing protein, partial [bacterium]
MKPVLVAVLLLALQPLSAQTWQWTRDDRVLNPSGIDINSNSAQFQVLDWNGDGLWDFMINETGALVYYERVPGQPSFWIKRDPSLPEVGLNSPIFYEPRQPKNFRFVDWDGDGDLDLAADGS